jgi:hypothetical protein
MDCRVPGDFTFDPTQYVVGDMDQTCPPTEVLISYRFRTITVFFKVTYNFPANTIYYLYLNGKVLDRNYKSGKAVPLVDLADVQTPMVAINPVLQPVSTSTYDPLCAKPRMMFSTVRHDAILTSDGYACPPNPLYSKHHGITHKNWVDESFKQLGYTLAAGSKAALKAGRQRLLGDDIITKKQGPTRRILSMRDYDYVTEFDKSRYQIQVGQNAPCTPLPAKRTANFVRIAEGIFPLEDLSIPGGPDRKALHPMPPQAEYVMVVVMDGTRLTETYGIPAYIPNIMTLASYGVKAANFYNYAPKTETVSGHAALMTGLYEDIPNDGSTSPLLPSYMQEWLYKKGITSYGSYITDRAMIITSEDKLYALRTSRTTDPWDRFRPYANCGANSDGTGGYRSDAATHLVAKTQIFVDSPPNLSLISYAETDTYAKIGDWDNYIKSIQTIDQYIGELWMLIQSHRRMANKTILMITNDCGRRADNFMLNGGTTEAEQHIMYVVIGPWVKQNIVMTPYFGLIDIPATILGMLEMEKTTGVGSRMPIDEPVFITAM